jgi:hypothetical protein
MPIYHLILKPTGGAPLADRDGQDFTDLGAVHAHATQVAHEIMRNREPKCRPYRLQVSDENLEPCFEILFASIDETLDHMPTDFRHSIEETARATASLNDTILEMTGALRRFEETLFVAGQVHSAR